MPTKRPGMRDQWHTVSGRANSEQGDMTGWVWSRGSLGHWVCATTCFLFQWWARSRPLGSMPREKCNQSAVRQCKV
jgi:hypothetical protein